MSLEDAKRLVVDETKVNRGQGALYAEITSAINRLRREMGLTPADVLGALEGAKLNYWDGLRESCGDDDPKEEAPRNA
jgi:hypothetical protein